MKEWIQAITDAQHTQGFADRAKRTCYELQNLQITFTEDFEKPLRNVRRLGWHFPSNEELQSVFLQADHTHRYTYAGHIRRQLPEMISLLSEQPNTRRAVMYLTDEQHSKNQSHLPCLLSIWAGIRNNKLSITVYARSIDLVLGLPANLYQISVLAHTIAKQTQTTLKEITFCIASAHIFDDYTQELDQLIKNLKK